MSWNGFGDLDLSGVKEDEGYVALEPGEHEVVCTDAKVEQIEGTNNRKLVASFKSAGGAGSIRNNFNIFHSSSQAMEIGQRQLKSFLIAAGHPNPDKPGDVGTLVGLKCRVYVGMGKPWRDRNGNERQSPEIKRFINKDEATSKPSAGGEGTARAMDDEIPF